MKRNKKIRVTPFSHHNYWSIGMFFLMLGLAISIIFVGEKSIFLVSLFFLLIVVVALYLPLKLILIQVGVASIFTFVVLNHDSHLQIFWPWFIDTLVYLVVGTVVYYKVAQIQRHNQEIAALSHISTSLTKTLNLSELTSQVVDHIFSLFRADGCTIYLMEEEKKSLRVISAREAHESQDNPEILAQILNSHPRVGFGMVGWIAATGEPILSGDAEHDPRAMHIPGTPYDEESVIGIPLKSEGETFGVLWIYKLSFNGFNEEDLQLAQIFANQVSVALANARLYEHVRNLSETDSLTGLLNSRSLVDLTERAINHAFIAKGCVSLFFMDCDDFKGINDRFGHPVGDQFLQFYASLLLEGIREEDVVIRYAGDEFVVILPNTTMEAATRIGERLIETFHERCMGNNPALHATVSIGLATYPEHAKSAEDLIKHADAALYVSKRNGKDQLSVYIPNQESLWSI